MRMTTDEKYMRTALKQAEKAYNLGETPIGCVIVHEDKIIARGYNRRNTDKNPLAHAEVAAIKKASKKLGDWRPGRMYIVCDIRAMSDVCRCNCPVPYTKSGCRVYESESRMYRFHSESTGYPGI